MFIFGGMIQFLPDNNNLWLKYALKISKDKETASELVQEMYIKLNDKTQLNKSYVYMTLLTLFYDLKKQKKIVYLDDLKGFDISEEIECFESAEILKKILQEIPFEARECFIENQNSSYRELSKKYGLNYQYIRRLAEKAKKILKNNEKLRDLYYG